jgi:sporulation protein YlmC with PRC-barrel domain
VIRASDLLGCVVHTESGRKVGRVHDLRARMTASDWLLIGLVVGRGGMLSRLVGDGVGAGRVSGGDVVPWQAITRLEDGRITIRD